MKTFKKTGASLGRLLGATVQSAIVPLLTMVFYYILSLRFSTAEFGLLSWGNAVSMLLVTLISYGLEQIVLRRLATGNDTTGWVAAAFILHSLIGSAVMLATLLLLRHFLPEDFEGLALLPLLFLAQALNLLVVPLKTLLNARERFAPYAIISLCSNVLRLAAVLLMLRHYRHFELSMAAVLLLLPSVLEIIATGLYVHLAMPGLRWRVSWRGYKRLIKEAAPQALSVVFDITLARADWVMMGLLSTNAATGLYTFAYRGYEMLRLPVSVVSMLLMPRIAKLMQRGGQLDAASKQRIQGIFRLEMFLGGGLIVVMNVLWVPLMNSLTKGKYGSSDAVEAGLLSLCIPLHFAMNLMWMLAFSARAFKPVARIIIITSLINVGVNFLLIPLLNGKGAALAFTGTSLLQTCLYASLVHKNIIRISWGPLLASLTAAMVCYLVNVFSPLSPVLTIPLSLAFYVVLSYVLRQCRPDDLRFLQKTLSM